MIYDCFTFYNELDMLDKRLSYLSPVVDKFVLVESTVTHRGEAKELLFEKNKERYSEWCDKIIHVVVEDNPVGENPWLRENHQRNGILRGLDNCSPKDRVLISDLDEIPHRDVITMNHLPDIASLHMIAFQYNFDYIQVHEPWVGTIITTRQCLNEYTPQQLRNTRWKYVCLKNAGWHLSWFGDADFAVNKRFNFSHCYDKEVFPKTQSDFQKFIESGYHVCGHKLLKTPKEAYDGLPMELKSLKK